MTTPVQCCEVITPAVTDCKSIKLMGGFMGTIHPGRYLNASWIYPTLYEYNRRGECVLDLWWRDHYNRTDSKRFTIPFDTYFFDEEPSRKSNYKKVQILSTKRCDSPDLDVLDDCQPVDCHVKYDGHKNYFSWHDLLCVPSATCYADPDKPIPDVGFSPNCNQCSDLESPIEEEDMSYLLRPVVNMDIYETMAQSKVTPYHTIRCHHGVMNQDTQWCDCDPGWSSAPVPEDFSYQRTIFTHMCTIYKEETYYDALYVFYQTTIDVWRKESLYLFGVAVVAAIVLVMLTCCLEFCCRRKPKEEGAEEEDGEEEEPIYDDICEDVDDDEEDDFDLDSEATEICSSSENWSEDVSDFHFTEASSGHSAFPNSRRVTWGSKSNRTDKNSWQLNTWQDVDVLHPAKPSLKSQGSTGVESNESALSSTERQKMFETHFRLLISLLLRRQPCADAREHLDWIFQNCPSYQKRLVIRFMESFGMDVDENGNLRGFRKRDSNTRKKDKTRSCRLRPKKLDRAYLCQEKGESAWPLLKPDCDGYREEPDGSSDIDRTLTISPDYGDILKAVLPKCLDASPPPDPEIEPQQESDPEEQDQLLECSPPSLTPSQLDVASKEVTPIMKKASVIQFLALRHKNPSVTSGLPPYINYLKKIEEMRRSYSKFIEEIPGPISCCSGNESDYCIRKNPMDLINHWMTERVMEKLALLEERYRRILSNNSQWELTTQEVTGIIQNENSEHISLDEEETFINFFKNLVHFLFLLSCKRETMKKIMTTFGCRRHRTEMRFHPHVCLFLCYLQPVLFKFWKIVEVEKVLLEFFVVEYPQHVCLGFLNRLKKTTKFRICLYLHLYKILGMITRMEGVKEPFRTKFMVHINILQRDLVRFFKDMEKFKGLQKGVKSSYDLAGSLLSILEVQHYFMVQSLYKMCLIHVDKADS